MQHRAERKALFCDTCRNIAVEIPKSVDGANARRSVIKIHTRRYDRRGRLRSLSVPRFLYLRESAPSWAVDASCVRGWGDRAGRDSPSTTSSPGFPSRSRGCCWESLCSFRRLPYHPSGHSVNVDGTRRSLRNVPDGRGEPRSSYGMVFTARASARYILLRRRSRT